MAITKSSTIEGGEILDVVELEWCLLKKCKVDRGITEVDRIMGAGFVRCAFKDVHFHGEVIAAHCTYIDTTFE